MTRRFLDDIRDDINSLIVTNTTGAITAPIMNALQIDTIDSTVADEAGLTNTTPVVALAVNDTTWTVLPATAFRGGDLEFLIVDVAGNKITSSLTAGFTYNASGLASVEGTNNNVYEMAILQNGVATGFIGTVTTRGAGRATTLQAYDLELSTPASTEFQIGVRIVSAASGTLDVLASANTVTIKPTNNP